MDQRQRSDDATVEGHDALSVGQRVLHQGDVVHAHRGRLLAVCQEVRRHFSLAFDFDPPAALELVRLVPQHLVHLFSHLFRHIPTSLLMNQITHFVSAN